MADPRFFKLIGAVDTDAEEDVRFVADAPDGDAPAQQYGVLDQVHRQPFAAAQDRAQSLLRSIRGNHRGIEKTGSPWYRWSVLFRMSSERCAGFLPSFFAFCVLISSLNQVAKAENIHKRDVLLRIGVSFFRGRRGARAPITRKFDIAAHI